MNTASSFDSVSALTPVAQRACASADPQPRCTSLPLPPAPGWRSRRAHENYLRALWEAVLGGGPIGLDDDFFALGGQSPLIDRMLCEIRQATGQQLTLETLRNVPTIRQLAALIDAAAWDLPVPLVQLREGAGRPFFLVHSLTGNFLELWAVVCALDTSRPVLGLQARGQSPAQEPHLHVADMARDYIAHMRRVQAHGPYALGGFSIGGLIAFEIAQQLSAMGETVEPLCLIDTHVHGRYLPLRQWAQQRSARTLRFLGILRTLPPRDRAALVQKKSLVVLDRIRARFGLEPKWPEMVGDVVREAHFAPAARRLRGAMLFARREYRPKPYDGKVVFLRAAIAIDGDPLPFWRKVARGGLEVCVLPGDHDEMIVGANAKVLAAELVRHL
jgi:acetoacetyl-CoA synthetase